jgi:hypothetical protein
MLTYRCIHFLCRLSVDVGFELPNLGTACRLWVAVDFLSLSTFRRVTLQARQSHVNRRSQWKCEFTFVYLSNLQGHGFNALQQIGSPCLPLVLRSVSLTYVLAATCDWSAPRRPGNQKLSTKVSKGIGTHWAKIRLFYPPPNGWLPSGWVWVLRVYRPYSSTVPRSWDRDCNISGPMWRACSLIQPNPT